MNRIIIFALAVIISACSVKDQSIGDNSIVIFNEEAVNFNPAENCTNLDEKIIKVDNGRILLKKVQLPKYSKQATVSVQAEIKSAGDPWDKTGSLFLIPQSSDINFLLDSDFKAQFENQNIEFPGVVPTENYKPSIEILRFMTPFGIGYYSNDPNLMKRKPVYIPHWEEKVVWEQDVTQLISELEGEVWIGAFIDVWTQGGYEFSAKLNYTESKAEVDPITKTQVIPLVNTVRYIEPEKLYDGFSRGNLEYTFELPANYKSAQLQYITTGHGGHSGGDEFVKKENIITVNNEIIYSDIPWRDDCASFRRFNPHSGVWTEKRTAVMGNLKTGDTKELEIDEFIASSDYSRSNWCPGSQVEPFVIELNNLKKGENTISISIPQAQQEKENELNHWNVSAYITLQ
ncbi:peptide-N-glycosidase F-related protein [Saccharicrinis aurantiacus]|uniref:peptide-N-glycosidase F-related protein n=1 Tax=Saccharicrinis aurantiacus TaxID=1849719 RepID=UPI00083999C7|nr:PNGase F N-terminal domain-containing protein [Saccharicrinis aurantiacus]